jgi:hypothetical protein
VLIYYVDIQGQNGLISGINHISVKQRPIKKKGGILGYDLCVTAANNDDAKEPKLGHYPLFQYVSLCSLVQVCDEESGRIIRTWSVKEFENTQ